MRSASSSKEAGFSVSHVPQQEEDERGQWLELLVSGLTFDLTGLAPGLPGEIPIPNQFFGIPPHADISEFEAITIVPGPHIAFGATMLPVLRLLAGLSAELAGLPGCVGVCWHTARCLCSHAHFQDHVKRWLEGGVFPGLGLASLAVDPDDGLRSIGLSLFTGQELRIEPELTEDRSAAARIALRLLDELYAADPVKAEFKLTGPDRQAIRLSPSANGKFVRVQYAL